MASKHGTKIEWTHIPGYKGETWNPFVGCCAVSDGCKNCWAVRQANRFKDTHPQYEGTVQGGNWTGRVNRAPDARFYTPLRWRDPRAIFVCSMSDFFHEGADEWREHAWHQIYDMRQHLYLILTKRPERIPDCLPSFGKKEWPWPHVWLGASVENEDHKQRVHDLLNVRAAVRFLSLEPLLGNIDLSPFLCRDSEAVSVTGERASFRCGIRWVIAGGESGPGARPMHPAWLRSIRDQCKAADTPYFFKQQGEWEQAKTLRDDAESGAVGVFGLDNQPSIIRESSGWGARSRGWVNVCPLPSERVKVIDGMTMVRVGKKKAGRLLDGREWNEFPV